MKTEQWFYIIAVGIILGLMVKIFVLEIFTVPTDSMVPTIPVGSKVWLNKLILRGLKRGDVVGFERGGEFFVKRITGLPMDSVIKNGDFYEVLTQKDTLKTDTEGSFLIPKNGLTIELTDENYNFYAPLIAHFEQVTIGKLLSKTLINNVEQTKYTFKNDYFFVEGDNKNSSIDSRQFGLIGREAIKGRVSF